MKEYNKLIVWLNYFNSELKRSEGRRVPISLATRSPRLEELVKACERLNLEPQAVKARFPRTQRIESGYVSIKKVGAKQRIIMMIAKELARIKGEEQSKK